MADQQQQKQYPEQQQTRQALSVSSIIRDVKDSVLRDGMLLAAFRQGADEFAQALRAFPETIHAEVPGTLLNPTQGEIADDRKQKQPSPSEIARDKQPYRPQPGHDHDQGMER
jgi:hypothetical protein